MASASESERAGDVSFIASGEGDICLSSFSYLTSTQHIIRKL